MIWPFKKKRVDKWGLTRVDWKKYSHAYGPAIDVPEQLLALSSDDENAREWGISSLFRNIYHQGTVYEASKYAVPFLIEFAGNPEIADRHEILYLLSNLAAGNSYHDVHRSSRLETRGSTELDKIIEEEKRHVHDCREAVINGLPIYEKLLDVGDIEMQITLGFLLAMLGSAACETESALLKLATGGKHDEIRASFTLCLSYVSPSDETIDAIKNLDANELTPIHRVAAYISKLHLGVIRDYDQTLKELMGIIESPPEPEIYSSRQSWFEGGVKSLVTSRLVYFERESLLQRFDLLTKQLNQQDSFTVISIVRVLFALTFGEVKFDGNVENLNENQRKLIVRLFQSGVLVRREGSRTIGNPNTSSVAAKYGIPTTFEKLESLSESCQS